MILTGRTGLAALLGVLPIAVSPWPATAFVVLLVTLAIAVMLDTVLASSPGALQLTRSGNTSARLGEPVDVAVTVHNPGRRRLRGTFRETWPPSARAEPSLHTVDVGPGQTVCLRSVLRPVRRGDKDSAVLTVRSVGPLGLAGRQFSHRIRWSVRILPPFLSRKHLPARLAKLREIDGVLPVLLRGQGTEFDSLREYVVGDDVRSIDWRATARRADVVVRTWRPERDRRLVIVVDTGRMSAGRVGVDPTAADPSGWPRLDWSLDAALLLAALASRAGDNVDFIAYDRYTRAAVFGASRSDLLAQLVDAMAPMQPALIESDYAGMVSEVIRRVRGRVLVVLLTDLNASALEEGLLGVLPQLTRRHQVIVAAIADPRVSELAARRSDAAAVYDAAAAERSRNDRRAIATRLHRGGVEVLDAAPEELAPALADRYLALKAAGKL